LSSSFLSYRPSPSSGNGKETYDTPAIKEQKGRTIERHAATTARGAECVSRPTKPAPVPYYLNFLPMVTTTAPLLAVTVQISSSPVLRSMSFAMPSGTVVLNEVDFGLATVTALLNSPNGKLILLSSILICLQVGRIIYYIMVGRTVCLLPKLTPDR